MRERWTAGARHGDSRCPAGLATRRTGYGVTKSLLAVWLLAALVLSACDTFAPLPDPSDAKQFANAPLAVRERTPLPACGVETASGGGGVNVEGRRCLWAAYQEHRPAEFISNQLTVEGDPITWIYRVGAGGDVEVFLDSTRDAWSAKSWIRLACPGLSLIEGAPGQPAISAGLNQPGGDCAETTIQ